MVYYELLWAGVNGLIEYLSLHVITCLVPAFFLAGAISSLFSKETILRYFSGKKSISYAIAAVSGCLLAVCSCTVLPLFAGIYRKGAGLGPATTFLYSAPAINILAVVYTARALGYDLGLSRILAAVSLSVVVGLAMSTIFEGKETGAVISENRMKRSEFKTMIIFLLLLGILIGGGVVQKWFDKGLVILPQVAFLSVVSAKWLTKDDIREWMSETFFLVRQIFPLLVAAIFFMGMIVEVLPPEIIASYLGGNPVVSTSIASVSGALIYFCTLIEVPVVGGLISLGMDRGPALTMLLAGPALSLPNMIVLGRIMKFKKTAVYIFLVILMSMVSGLVYTIVV